jgi:signal transduction histidine kinase
VQLARHTAIFRSISEVLNRSYTLREALDGALRRICELLDVEAGWIFLHGPNPGEFHLSADVNLPAPLAVAGKRRMAGDCRCISMLREGTLREPVNVIQCLRLEQALPQNADRHRHASVPLVAQDETVGILNLMLPPGRTFTEEELDMLEAVGHELAVTIQRARLFEQVRAQEHVRRELLQRLLVAQEEERRRIARDLHDHAGQMMTALIIQLAQLATQAESDSNPLAAQLRRLHDLAQQGLDELRKLVHELRPAILDDLGLAPAVRWYAEAYVRPAGLEVHVDTSGLDSRLPPDVETVAFRIVQEALTNVLRHARAKRVDVRLDRRGDVLLAMVRDDGVGFDPEQPDRRTLGLAGMRERAELVGGTVQVLSVPGVGTTVLARIPVDSGPRSSTGSFPASSR